MSRHKGNPGPRPAWERITCHFCGGVIPQGRPVQWSYLLAFWGHPVCVKTAEEEADG